MRLFLPGGSSSGVTSVTGTAPVTSSGGATPAIGLTAMTYWAVNGGNGATTQLIAVANQTFVVGVLITWPISVGHIRFNVATLDNSANLYDLGFYNAAGTLVANIGPASYTTGGFKTAALAQGTVLLNPGLYWSGFTGNASVLGISAYANNALSFAFGGNANVAASVGGALPASITPPTVTPTNTFMIPYTALFT